MGMAICLLCSNAVADHRTLTFGIDSAGPIRTICANTIPSGTFAFGFQSEIIDNDEFSTQQLESFADSGLEGVHSIDQIWTSLMSASGRERPVARLNLSNN